MEKDKLAHFTVLFMQPVTKQGSGNKFRGLEIFLLYHFHTHVCEGIICLLLLVFKFQTQENEKYFTVFKTYLFKLCNDYLVNVKHILQFAESKFFLYTTEKNSVLYHYIFQQNNFILRNIQHHNQME